MLQDNLALVHAELNYASVYNEGVLFPKQQTLNQVQGDVATYDLLLYKLSITYNFSKKAINFRTAIPRCEIALFS